VLPCYLSSAARWWWAWWRAFQWWWHGGGHFDDRAHFGGGRGHIGVVIGGIVSLGSNVSTLREMMAAMSAAEVLRSDLISRIDLRVVGDGTMKRL